MLLMEIHQEKIILTTANEAGQSTSSDNNVFIGYQAGRINSSMKVYIPNSSSSNLIIGDYSTGDLSLGQTSGA